MRYHIHGKRKFIQVLGDPAGRYHIESPGINRKLQVGCIEDVWLYVCPGTVSLGKYTGEECAEQETGNDT